MLHDFLKTWRLFGEKVILPSSFVRSTRYFAKNFEDAFAIVRRLRPPDFFVSVTYNPDWPEFKETASITLDDIYIYLSI